MGLCVLQKDTTSLTTENSELKLRLQSMEQQAHLRDGIHSQHLLHFQSVTNCMDSLLLVSKTLQGCLKPKALTLNPRKTREVEQC